MAYALFFLINILYISFEVFFNFTLLNVVSNSSATIEDIHSLEDIGRFLAASGFSLLFWKFIHSKGYHKKWNQTFISSIIIGSIITTISFFSFYEAQNKYIDHLAKNFSNETKQKIYDLQLLKKGLISGNLELQNIPYNVEMSDNTESKTFIIGLPLFLINNEKTLSHIEKNREKIANHIYGSEIREDPEKIIPIYRKVLIDIDTFFSDYREISKNKYNDMNYAKKTALNSFSKMHYQLKRKYKYTRTRMSYNSWVNTAEIKNLIINKIRSEYKLNVTKDFNPIDKKSYMNALIYSVADQYNNEYENKIKSNNYPKVPLGIMEKNKFYKHPEIVLLLKKSLGAFYFEADSFGNYGFRTRTTLFEDKNLIIQNSSKISKALTKEHINKNINSEEVHNIVKAMIVPPIALILSIFFAFINLFLLIKGISFKIFSKFNKYPKLYSNIIMYLLVSILLTMPLILNNSYTEKEAYQKVYKNMSDNNKLLAFSANWILRFEPFIYTYAENIPFINLKENFRYNKFIFKSK